MNFDMVASASNTRLLNQVLSNVIPEFKQSWRFVENGQLFYWRDADGFTSQLDKVYVRDLTPKEKMVFDCYKDMVRVLREE